MTEDILKPEVLFELSKFDHRDIFLKYSSLFKVLAEISSYLQEQMQTKYKPNYGKNLNVFIGEGTVIHPGVEIIGPAIIGKNCIIGHASYLRENCLIGDNVRVGHGVELKNSILFNHATLAHLNYIGDSIIGNNVNISGGAMCANFRLDKKLVTLRIEKKEITTNLQKLGSIIGDNSIIGANAVLNPGTIIGKNVKVYPLTSVVGIHDHNEVITHSYLPRVS